MARIGKYVNTTQSAADGADMEDDSNRARPRSPRSAIAKGEPRALHKLRQSFANSFSDARR